MICGPINHKKLSQGCVKAPGEEGRPGSVSESPCLSRWPSRCSPSRRLRSPPRTPKRVHWAGAILQAPLTRVCARALHNRLKTRPAFPVLPQPAPGSQLRARAVEPRGDENPGRKPAFPSRPLGSESGVGIGPPPEDPVQAAWQSRLWGGPLQRGSAEPWGPRRLVPTLFSTPRQLWPRPLARAGRFWPPWPRLNPAGCGPGRAERRRAGPLSRRLPAARGGFSRPPWPALGFPPPRPSCRSSTGAKPRGWAYGFAGVCAPGAPCARRRSLQGRARGLPHRAGAWRPGVHPDLGLSAPGRAGGSRRAAAGLRGGLWPP